MIHSVLFFWVHFLSGHFQVTHHNNGEEQRHFHFFFLFFDHQNEKERWQKNINDEERD